MLAEGKLMTNPFKLLRFSAPVLAALVGTATPALTAGGSAPAAPTQVAQAPTAPAKMTTTTTKYGGWTVQCNESGEPLRKVCGANYRVVDKKRNSSILVWRIGHSKDGKLMTEFVTPTDVRIEPGVAITLGEGKPIKAGFVECTGKSCKASTEVSPNIARQLKAASKVTVEITRRDGKVIQFAMEIPGIEQALADLGV